MAFPLVPTLPFTAATSTIPSSVANAWRVNFPACLDADQGGTYANTDPIIFDAGSAGWQFGAGVTVLSTGFLTVAVGSTLTVAGTATIVSGGSLVVASGGTLTAAVGSDVDFLAPIRVAGLNNNGSAIPVTDAMTVSGNLTVNATVDADKVIDGLNVPAVVAYAASVTLDFAVSVNAEIGTMTGNLTLNFSNMPIGRAVTIRVTQDATGGRTITWPGGIFFGQHDDQPNADPFNGSYYVFMKTSDAVIWCMARTANP